MISFVNQIGLFINAKHHYLKQLFDVKMNQIEVFVTESEFM